MCEYSIWLTLEESSSAHVQLKRLIDTLASSYDDASVFEPHLTLVGGINGDRQRLTRTVSTLGEETEPFDLDISGVQCSTTAHQCVFRLVEPSLQLLQLRRQAMAALERSTAMYVPHLSLIYSDMDLEQRIALAGAIDPAALPEHMRVTTIEVVATSAPVTDWESVYTVTLY